MSGSFPTSPPPSSMTVRSLQPTRVSIAHNLKRQVRGGTSQQWAFDLAWSALTRAELAPILAFAMAQKGQYETFTFIPPVMSDAIAADQDTNLLKWSESLGNTVWPQSADVDVNITNDAATAPDGYTTAEKIVEATTTTAYRQISQQLGALDVPENSVVTFSIYLKSSERTRCKLYVKTRSGAYPYATFDLTAVTATVGGVTTLSATIELIADGWYRCSMTVDALSGVSSVQGLVRLLNAAGSDTYAGVVGYGIYAWGAQLRIGSTPGDYVSTTTRAPLAMGVTASGRSVPTDGWGPNKVVLNAGDFVKFASHNKVYMLTADAVSDGSGQATLAIEPPLYASVADNSVVTYYDVPFTVAMGADAQEVGVSAPFISSYACNLIEVV